MINASGAPSLGELIHRKGGWMIDQALSERLGVVVIDGRKIVDGSSLNDFKEVVEEIYGKEISERFSSTIGSCWLDDVIVIGADIADSEVRVFVLYHEYKHWLDYVQNGVVPSDEHSSVRSSRIEKVCDLYALRRVVREMGTKAAQKAIEWMVNYHFQWDAEHPEDPSDLLYRAILLYRFCRRQGLSIEPDFDMKKLQRSKRWWG